VFSDLLPGTAGHGSLPASQFDQPNF